MSDGYRCHNCIDDVWMTDLGDGDYQCPVCGDEFNAYEPIDAQFEGTPPPPEYDDDNGDPEWEYGDSPDLYD